jgi:hypothetical protein
MERAETIVQQKKPRVHESIELCYTLIFAVAGPFYFPRPRQANFVVTDSQVYIRLFTTIYAWNPPPAWRYLFQRLVSTPTLESLIPPIEMHRYFSTTLDVINVFG